MKDSWTPRGMWCHLSGVISEGDVGLHVSSHRLKHNVVDAEGANEGLLDCEGDVQRECEVCQAFEKALRLSVTGTSGVSPFNGKIQMDLPFLDDVIALHAMDMSSRSPPLLSWRARRFP